MDIDFLDSPVELASLYVGGQFMAIYCSTIPALRPSDWRARLWAMGIFRDIVHALVQRCFVITLLCLMFNLNFYFEQIASINKF